MQSFSQLWTLIYTWTKVPMTPLYGGFPVKLTTHVGEPIFPGDYDTVEDLRVAVVEAMKGLIDTHQVHIYRV